MPQLRLDFDTIQTRRSAKYILDSGSYAPKVFTQEYTDHVSALWFDSGIRECYRRSNEFQLIDSAK